MHRVRIIGVLGELNVCCVNTEMYEICRIDQLSFISSCDGTEYYHDLPLNQLQEEQEA